MKVAGSDQVNLRCQINRWSAVRSAIPPPTSLTYSRHQSGNSAQTVLAANVFPSAGVTAMFSNAVITLIVVRRATWPALVTIPSSRAGDNEYRFSFQV